jgi:hypothetical protein
VGLMQWLRGNDDAATAVMSAGLAEIGGLFQPSRHKQTEHVEESKRRRVDVANGTGVDLERGIAVISGRPRSEPVSPDGAAEPDVIAPRADAERPGDARPLD